MNITRREFLARITAVTAAAGTVNAKSANLPEGAHSNDPCYLEDDELSKRLRDAYEIRLKAATFEKNYSVEKHICNKDESHPQKLGSFTKALPHNKLGEVDLRAYEVLLRAVKSGKNTEFESIPLGGYVKLANPHAGLAFDLLGPDCCQIAIRPAPSFSSKEIAAEAAELYWHSLCRDIPFNKYEFDRNIAMASEELSEFSQFTGPKLEGNVTPATLFRGNTTGDLVGPYISQFLLRDIPFSPIRAAQKIRTTVAELDYLMKYDRWLAIQNGTIAEVNKFDSTPRYIRNGRDLCEYVHRDFTYQAFLAACLMLLNMGTPPDGGNPYKYSRTQSGFVTFGAPYALHLVSIVANIVLKSTWFLKWMVHRRLRPEEFCGRIHNHLTGAAQYPIDSEILNAPILSYIYKRNGTYLLPTAYPEGCPTHPAYPAGHAAISGACATVLKACFDESYVIPKPVVPSDDGLTLQPYKGPPLTVGGELNKLASNISIGRDFAGIHWRSDSIEGIKLGEAVAIRILKEIKMTGQEIFEGFSLTTFEGSRITI